MRPVCSLLLHSTAFRPPGGQRLLTPISTRDSLVYNEIPNRRLCFSTAGGWFVADQALVKSLGTVRRHSLVLDTPPKPVPGLIKRSSRSRAWMSLGNASQSTVRSRQAALRQWSLSAVHESPSITVFMYIHRYTMPSHVAGVFWSMFTASQDRAIHTIRHSRIWQVLSCEYIRSSAPSPSNPVAPSPRPSRSSGFL